MLEYICMCVILIKMSHRSCYIDVLLYISSVNFTHNAFIPTDHILCIQQIQLLH